MDNEHLLVALQIMHKNLKWFNDTQTEMDKLIEQYFKEDIEHVVPDNDENRDEVFFEMLELLKYLYAKKIREDIRPPWAQDIILRIDSAKEELRIRQSLKF